MEKTTYQIEKHARGCWCIVTQDGAVLNGAYPTKGAAQADLDVATALVQAFRAAGTRQYTHTEYEVWSLVDDVERTKAYLASALRRLAEEVSRDAQRLEQGYTTWNACRGYADRGSDLVRLNAEHEFACRALHRTIQLERRANPTGDVAVAHAAVTLLTGVVL
jgi:hypothetical protein